MLLLFVRLYRGNFQKLLFYSVCLSAGIAGLVSVGIVLSSVKKHASSRTREILGADIEVSSSRPFSDSERRFFSKLESRGLLASETISFFSMISPKNKSSSPFLANVRAVDDRLPHFGRLETTPLDAVALLRLQPNSCLLDGGAAARSSLKLGDFVLLGRRRLQIVGLLHSSPGGGFGSFEIAPVVIIPLSEAEKSGLLAFGSRIRRRRSFSDPSAQDPESFATTLKSEISRELDSPHLSITAFMEAQPALSRAIERVSGFFILVSVGVLALASVAIKANLESFLSEQFRSAALLRCLGLTPAQVAALYRALCGTVAVQGSLLGIGLGWALSSLGVGLLEKISGNGLGFKALPGPAVFAEAAAVSFVLALGLPFMRIRDLCSHPPAFSLKNSPPQSPRLLLAGSALIYFLLLTVLTGFKSGSFSLTGTFALALGISACFLGGAAWIFLSFLERNAGRFDLLALPIRLGLMRLGREKSHFWLLIFSLSAGFSLLGALEAVRGSLAKELSAAKRGSAADLFLADIQKSQLDSVRNLVGSYAVGEQAFSPLIRARLSAVNGNPVRRREGAAMNSDDEEKNRFLLREFNLSYSAVLNPSESIVSGRFWGADAPPQISLEKGFASRTGIKLGDLLRFDIQGRNIEAPVSSLRSVEWISMRPNFFVLFPPEVLQGAPKTFIASFRLKDRGALNEFERSLVSLFPNVSVIDAGKILALVQTAFDALLFALQAIALFSTASGLLVLAAAAAVDRKGRLRRAGLFRALGLRARDAAVSDGTAFLVCGTAAFLLGFTAAAALGKAAAVKLGIGFSISPISLGSMLFAAALLPTVIGLLMGREAYSIKPSVLLREN